MTSLWTTSTFFLGHKWKTSLGKEKQREQAQGKEGGKQAKPYQEGGENPYHLITQSLGDWKHHLMWRSSSLEHMAEGAPHMCSF
jgi:hypothetical protein